MAVWAVAPANVPATKRSWILRVLESSPPRITDLIYAKQRVKWASWEYEAEQLWYGAVRRWSTEEWCLFGSASFIKHIWFSEQIPLYLLVGCELDGGFWGDFKDIDSVPPPQRQRASFFEHVLKAAAHIPSKIDRAVNLEEPHGTNQTLLRLSWDKHGLVRSGIRDVISDLAEDLEAI